jgi:ribosomal protein S18 acetylase RimI-like enzyme
MSDVIKEATTAPIATSKPKITIRYLGSIMDQNSAEAQAIKDIMIACDEEFVPPLSFREDTTKNMVDQHADKADITPYWKIVLTQENIAAFSEAGEVIAFMSFINNYKYAEYFPGVVENGDRINYVSTICTLKDYRGQGITSRFYEMMESSLPSSICGACVATRTWSTNDVHIHLLEKRGYELTHTKKKDRVTKTGEHLDTVYFCKRVACQ